MMKLGYDTARPRDKQAPTPASETSQRMNADPGETRLNGALSALPCATDTSACLVKLQQHRLSLPKTPDVA